MPKRKPLIHIVRFEDNSAWITNNGDFPSAIVLFLEKKTYLFADGGSIDVCNLQELPEFIAKLPRYAGRLKKQLRKLQNPQAERIELRCGKNGIVIEGTADVGRFIQQVTARYNELKGLLSQVEVCAELATAPIALQGLGIFIDGRFSFWPDRLISHSSASPQNPQATVPDAGVAA